MSVFLRGLSKVGYLLTVTAVVAFCSGCGTSAVARNLTTAQSNLFTALTAARTFYSANHDSYVGVEGGSQLASGVSSITGLDTGLTYISGHQVSIRPNVVSTYSPSPSVLVITTVGTGPRVCWGILSLRHNRTHPYLSAFPEHNQGWHLLLSGRLGEMRGCNNRPGDIECDEVPDNLSRPRQTSNSSLPNRLERCQEVLDGAHRLRRNGSQCPKHSAI